MVVAQGPFNILQPKWFYTAPNKKGSHMERRGVLFCASGNPNMLIFEIEEICLET